MHAARTPPYHDLFVLIVSFLVHFLYRFEQLEYIGREGLMTDSLFLFLFETDYSNFINIDPNITDMY